MANLWLFKPLLERKLSATPSANASHTHNHRRDHHRGRVSKRTCCRAGPGAVVNCRILPGDSIERVISHVRDVADDPRVIGQQVRSHLPASRRPASATDAAGFRTVQRTIRQLFPGCAGRARARHWAMTDSRHYAKLTNSIYRFCPMRVGADDLERVHGINERIAVTDYAAGVKFYYQLIKSSMQ